VTGGLVPGDVRIGLIVPSSNTVMEVDLYRRLPARFHVHTARMFLEETTPEGESEMLDEHVMPAARDLGTARPHAVVFGCTSAGALRGNAYDVELCDRIAAVTGAQTISTIASVREAVDRRGAGRVGIITPYVDALNDRIRASIEADGVGVAAIHGLGIDENFAIAQVTPDRIVDFAATSFAGAGIELLFASCTNFRAFDALEAIADALGVPVVTSNQAVVEAVMRRFGATGEAPPLGDRVAPAR
jgi:maleate isomerase